MNAKNTEFRIRDVHNNIWLDNKMFNIGCSIYSGVSNINCKGFIGGVEVNQYIGKEDSQGQRLYEHDIVQSRDGSIWLIKYSNYFLSFGFWKDGDQRYITYYNSVRDSGLKIIGNLYDNENILKDYIDV